MTQEDHEAQILEQYQVIRNALGRLGELGEGVASHGHGTLAVYLEGDTFILRDKEIVHSETFRVYE